MSNLDLPEAVRELAEILGRERALYLIGNYPRFLDRRNGCRRISIYIPSRLKPNHRLVKMLGIDDAQRLIDTFQGEILKLPTCEHLYRNFRNLHIVRLVREGVPPRVVGEWFGICERTVNGVILAEEGPRRASRRACM